MNRPKDIPFSKRRPPRWAEHLLEWFCAPHLLEEVQGDLHELYGKWVEKHGVKKARWLYVIHTLKFFRPYAFKRMSIHNPTDMLKNYLKISTRILLRYKLYSFLNIAGLALGMTCFTVILLFVENELSYDRFHQHPENIYRVVKDFVNEDGTKIPDATTPPALTPALQENVPEVEQVTRFFPNWGRLYLLEYDEKRFYETELIRVDSSFFKVFDFPFVAGNQEQPFHGIHSIILTESIAKKYFGEEDPLNKVIRMNLNNGTDFVVSGVVKDVPQNSHFTFDFLIPFESGRNPDTDWDWYGFYTYVRVKSGTDLAAFESKVSDLFKQYQPNSPNEYYIQPLTDIHLKSRLKWELSENGDIAYVKILMAIGLFVIFIAAINYVNLVTAQSAKRAKEVGIRKVTGTTRYLLMQQFLVESILTALVALVFSILLTTLFLPLTKSIFGYDFESFLSQSQYVKLILPGFALLIGILAGIYPAFYLSSFEPLKVLKGSFLSSLHGIHLRQGLVVFQFVISISLIIGSLVIMRQLDFMQQKKLGFDPEHVLLLPNVRGGVGSPVIDPGAMVEELKSIPSVISMARADGILGSVNSTNGISTKNNETHIALNFIRVDYDFLPTLNIPLKEGRNFSDQFVSDKDAIILNEKAVEQLGLKKPYIGQQLAWDDEQGKTHDVNLIGIVEDFHFTSFREAIKPFGFTLEVGNGSTFFLKIHSQNLDQSMAAIEKSWAKHQPGPFEYSFQDEHLAKLTVSEARFQQLFSWFSVLAIFITCLGLFGLVTYVAESKTKEIGIRKVLGATIHEIVMLLLKDFIRLVLIAQVIASPIAWYIMHQWLQDFAYRIHIEWWIFALAGILALLIAILTVSFQSIKASLANPVNSLRNE